MDLQSLWEQYKTPILEIVGVLGGIAVVVGFLKWLFGWRKRKKQREIQEKQASDVEEVKSMVRSQSETLQRVVDYLNGLQTTPNINLRELFEKGYASYKSAKYSEAIDTFRRCLALKPEPSEKVALLTLVGNSFSCMSELEEAEGHYREALSTTERVEDERERKEGKATALGNIGLIYQDKGDLDQALKYHEDNLKVAREIGLRQSEAAALGNIGLIYKAQGDLNRALKYHQEALKIDKEIGFREGEAQQIIAIGLVLEAKGNLDEALTHYEKAIKIHKEIGFKKGEAIALNNIGLVYEAKGDLERALNCYKEALKIFEEIGMPEEIGIAKRNIERISQQISQQMKQIKQRKADEK